MKVPFFSSGGATGKITSARSVTSLRRTSRLTRKSTRSRASRAAAGSSKSRRSTPPTTRALTRPSVAASSICDASSPRVAGISPHARLSRASALDTGRPKGRSPGRRPASRPPRSPARRGTHWMRALQRWARRTTSLSRPGVRLARSPTRITPPSRREARSANSPPSRISAATSTSVPGAQRSSSPESLARPREVMGAKEATRSLPLRVALRIRRKSAPHSSSGSSPTRRTWPALSSCE